MALTKVDNDMVTGLTKTDVGLTNVDNTSDANKPVSTATQTALDLKAPLASPTFTGTVSGITKTMVGLGSVDNTSDVAKPVSTAQQTALDLKAPLASPTFTGTVSGITKSMVGLGSVDNTSDTGKPVSTAQQTALDLKANIASPTFTGTVGGITKSMVGLANVDNTSDAAKPVSTATQTALDLKVTGPAGSVTADRIALFDGTTGELIKEASVGISGLATAAQGAKADTATQPADLASYAPLASPALTGTPTAPTASGATNTTQIATTAMVQAAIASVTGGSVTGPGTSTNNSVAGFNGTGGTVIKELTAAQIRTAAALDTGDSPQFTAINLGHASDTTLTRVSAGVIAIEGKTLDISAASVTISAAAATVLDDASVAAMATTLGLGTASNPQFATIELGAASDTTLSRSAAGVLAVEGVVVALTGKQAIPIPAGAMKSRTTNGAAAGTVEMTTNKNMVVTLDFDTSTQEFAQFSIPMPKSWNESTITFVPHWSHASTTTNFGVVWSLAGVAVSNDDAMDVAFGTAQTSTDTGGTTNDYYAGPESSAITIAGSPAENDLVMFQVARVPSDGSDTMAIDARLHGITLYITTNAGNDA